jgi:hypothetical protein
MKCKTCTVSQVKNRERSVQEAGMAQEKAQGRENVQHQGNWRELCEGELGTEVTKTVRVCTRESM